MIAIDTNYQRFLDDCTLSRIVFACIPLSEKLRWLLGITGEPGDKCKDVGCTAKDDRLKSTLRFQSKSRIFNALSKWDIYEIEFKCILVMVFRHLRLRPS